LKRDGGVRNVEVGESPEEEEEAWHLWREDARKKKKKNRCATMLLGSYTGARFLERTVFKRRARKKESQYLKISPTSMLGGAATCKNA